MATAKLFQHGGSQALRLPREFRFEGTEVEIERRGGEVVLRPKPKPRLETLLFAAHARRLGATLVTANFREFSRVTGLQCLEWAAP